MTPRRALFLLRSRPRLWLACLFGLLLFWAQPADWVHHLGSRFLVAWNLAALLYLALAAHMMGGSTREHMLRRAIHQEEGRWLVLALVVLASLTVLYAVGSQLAVVKDLHGLQRSRHVALAALTVVSSWLFTQTMFALQYAHDFYRARGLGQPDPLDFPGTAEPDYLDFMYFACVIGTSGQTADVSFSGSALRGMGAVHCVLSFFFNTTVLALTINIAAGLF
jgi:uncharacterized membrane protein